MMSEPITLCALDDVADGGSNGFIAETPDGRRGFIVVRKGGQAFVYVNSCPHIGSPLDFEPGKFLNFDQTHIMCSTHGALFTIEDGHCISGPCAGQGLEAVSSAVADGKIVLLFS
jgi:nitrite reductase/ring-hydroxylating ferredoxin subunit